jgi:hypothetical protein
VLGKCRRLQNSECGGAVGIKKEQTLTKILEKCNFAVCDTVHVCRCIFIFLAKRVAFPLAVTTVLEVRRLLACNGVTLEYTRAMIGWNKLCSHWLE